MLLGTEIPDMKEMVRITNLKIIVKIFYFYIEYRISHQLVWSRRSVVYEWAGPNLEHNKVPNSGPIVAEYLYD